jgi:3-oxoacid CoA-transferase subunit B
MAFSRQQIAERAAREISPGSVVNLGIGLPTMIPDYLPADRGVWFHSENGLLGMGPFPFEGEEDPLLINAGKQTVTLVPGGSTFDSALSFTMIRGGHVDAVFLGAMQVSERGDIANWAVPGGKTMGIGGAMDLATGCRRVVVLTMHTTRDGAPKLLRECTYPLTARNVVSRVITNLGVIDVTDRGFSLVECAPEVTPEEVQQATAAELILP